MYCFDIWILAKLFVSRQIVDVSCRCYKIENNIREHLYKLVNNICALGVFCALRAYRCKNLSTLALLYFSTSNAYPGP